MGYPMNDILDVINRLNEKKKEITMENVVDLLDLVNSVIEKKTKEKDDLCVVCFSSPINAILLTCGHMALCYKCAIKEFKRSKKCVICRQEIREVIQTYKAN